ncbi:ECF-type sigma factor [Streptomyces sp. NPDC003442]
MPPKKKLTLTDEVRETMEEALELSHEGFKRAHQEIETFKMKVSLANQGGLTIEEIAVILGVSSSTVGRWKMDGDEARKRRRSAHLERSRQLEPNG